MINYYDYISSPLGDLLAVRREAGLTGLYFTDQKYAPQPGPHWVRDPARFPAERRQLGEYFAGTRDRFELALAPVGTPFQVAVWGALALIPPGETRTYAQLARAIGAHPGAARAVGAANGRNPHTVIVPCHRVIGASGALTGYAGGLARKRWLLEHESAQRP